jgi:hypothetical protein
MLNLIELLTEEMERWGTENVEIVVASHEEASEGDDALEVGKEFTGKFCPLKERDKIKENSFLINPFNHTTILLVFEDPLLVPLPLLPDSISSRFGMRLPVEIVRP